MSSDIIVLVFVVDFIGFAIRQDKTRQDGFKI